MAQSLITDREIISQIQKGQFKPIYLLMGDESYYIDRISEYIASKALTKEEQDFNQTIIYCTRETSVSDIINSARRYPMMAKFQVVIVKEAQNLLKLEDLLIYVKEPLMTTILVICYKNGSIDRRKKIIPAIENTGVVFESNRLKEGMLPDFITGYLRRKQIAIDSRACLMMAENVGSDLNRLAGELDKLALVLPNGQTQITPEMIKEHVGISKEFNLNELRDGIVRKDLKKTNKIIFYFDQNPKTNPPQRTLSTLFSIFTSTMLAWYAPERTESGLMAQLDYRDSWRLRNVKTSMQNYSALKTMQIIGKIRETDAKLKGINKGNLTDSDIMHELIYFITH